MTSSRMPFPGFIRDHFSLATPNINLCLGSRYKAEASLDAGLILLK